MFIVCCRLSVICYFMLCETVACSLLIVKHSASGSVLCYSLKLMKNLIIFKFRFNHHLNENYFCTVVCYIICMLTFYANLLEQTCIKID